MSEVKVGQVRRGSDGFIFEVKETNGNCCVIKWRHDSGEDNVMNFLIKTIESYSEVVTMGNIQIGEWIECINSDYRFGVSPIAKGCKYKAGVVSESKVYVDNNYRWKSLFKPCLPPCNNYNQESNYEKPPLGLIPRDISESKYRQDRINEIVDAMERYMEANKEIPYEWIQEYNELICEEIKANK